MIFPVVTHPNTLRNILDIKIGIFFLRYHQLCHKKTVKGIETSGETSLKALLQKKQVEKKSEMPAVCWNSSNGDTAVQELPKILARNILQLKQATISSDKTI